VVMKWRMGFALLTIVLRKCVLTVRTFLILTTDSAVAQILTI
jgi:hypothetical protein